MGTKIDKGDVRSIQRSPEVEELLGSNPLWIVKWGFSLILVVLGVLFGFAYFISYPDSVKCEIEVFEQGISETVKSYKTSYLTILKPSSRHIKSNEIVAVYGDSTFYTGVKSARLNLNKCMKDLEEGETIINYRRRSNIPVQLLNYYLTCFDMIDRYNAQQEKQKNDRLLNLLLKKTHELNSEISTIRAELKNSEKMHLKKPFLSDNNIIEKSKQLARLTHQKNRIDSKILQKQIINNNQIKFVAIQSRLAIDSFLTASNDWLEQNIIKSNCDGDILIDPQKWKSRVFAKDEVVFKCASNQNANAVIRASIPLEEGNNFQLNEKVTIRVGNTLDNKEKNIQGVVVEKTEAEKKTCLQILLPHTESELLKEKNLGCSILSSKYSIIDRVIRRFKDKRNI